MTLRTVTIGHCALAKSKPGGARQEWPAAFKKAYSALVSGFQRRTKMGDNQRALSPKSDREDSCKSGNNSAGRLDVLVHTIGT